MRVVQLVMSRQYRGAEIFAANLSRELKNSGIEVLYLSLYKNKADQVFIPEGIAFNDLGAEKSMGLSIRLIRQLSGALREFDPDIVQANAGDTLKYVVMAKLIFGLRFKIVFRNASTVSRYFNSWVQKTIYLWMYKFVDKIISVSHSSMDDFVKAFPTVGNKIEVIPNSFVQKPFRKLDSFQAKDFNIVHVAGFTFEKNHEGMLRIFQSLLPSVPNARLWLVGDGLLKEKIGQRAAEMSLDRIITVGAVTNPLDYIASADVLVLPSVIEGLPGVILEAFYVHCPVVAYQVGGISEVVKNGETGWLVAPNDEAKFVEAIQEIAKGHDLSVIKANAHRLVIEHFDNRIISEKFLSAYSKMIGIESSSV
jgi:L-malate glycosyltransferase